MDANELNEKTSYEGDVRVKAGEFRDVLPHGHIICCDCSLTHRYEHRISADGKMQRAFWRNEEDTRINRRKKFGKQAPLVTEMLSTGKCFAEMYEEQ
jgi:hypothetical protein